MARRDYSQGFGFNFIDPRQLLAATQAPADSDAPVLTPPSPEAKASVDQVKENLDRLQSLHHKLHAMLEELNALTPKKKK